MLFLSVWFSKSYKRRIFSPMNLSGTKPVWSSEIKSDNTDFIRLAIQADASLYETFKSEIGLQFFRNCRGLSPFGKRVT